MPNNLTPRQKVVLAAFAAENGARFAPVQVQKLFFLIDENLSQHVGGKHFAFEPYDYGPFDKTVYDELEALARRGLVQVESTAGAGRRSYFLTPRGQEIGASELGRYPAAVQSYVTKLSKWIRRLSFAALVGSIYKAYPHMREKSVFVD